MRILVTGSEGVVGKPLCKALEATGHEVSRLDRFHGRGVIRADIANYRQLAGALYRAEPEMVFNLAAEFGRNNGEDYYEECWHSNVVGLKTILELQKIHEFQLVHFSSSEIYGEVEDMGTLRENLTEAVPVFPKNDYAISKWVNELQIRNHLAKTPHEVMTVRLFNAYGPGEVYHDYRSVVCLFTYRLLHGLPITLYDGYTRPFMFINDLISTLCKIPEAFKSGEIVNVGGKEIREVKDVVDLLAASGIETDGLVRALPKDLHNVVSKYPDMSKAAAMLDHDPVTSLEEGIPMTLAWMRETYG